MPRLLFVAVCMAGLLGCGRQPHGSTPPATPPAKVQNPVKEADLTTVTLTPEAEARLAIRTAPVEDKQIEGTRSVGGEVVAPSGRALTVTAPVAGTLLPPSDGAPLAAGASVAKGQTVFRLRPLAPSSDIAGAQARLEAVRARALRAQQLLEVGAGSARAVEEARAELAASESNWQSLRPAADTGAGDAVVVSSPENGVIRDVKVAAGQSVSASAPLFEIAARDPLWVRVPVYVGDMPSIDAARGARVHEMSDRPGAEGRHARLVSGPPSADPGSATADLYFEIGNADGALRPGQRVGVTLVLREQERGRVVPWAAVLYDIHGGTWVYENTAPHVFVRRRVDVRRVAGDLAVLAHGPAAGAKIVTTGAAELFGTELGIGK